MLFLDFDIPDLSDISLFYVYCAQNNTKFYGNIFADFLCVSFDRFSVKHFNPSDHVVLLIQIGTSS